MCPPTHNLNFSLYLVARGWEYFKFLGDLLYWGVLISLLGEGARPFSSIKPSMTNCVNSRTVDGKIICLMCALSHFYLWNFLFENFLSVQVSIETLKKVFTTVR